VAHDRGTLRKPSDHAPRAPPRQVAPVQALAISPALQLQRRLGNDAAQRFFAHAQRAAAVSSPHDPAELEALAMARQVVRMPEAGVSALGTPARATPGGPIQRATAAAAPAAAPSSVMLPSGVGAGAPLPSGVRSYMEPRFGAGFSNVRVHTGEHAAQMSQQLGAHAFTVGEHVFFGRDQFRPDTDSGRELIAHELTHTVQQGAAVQRSADPNASPLTVSERSAPQVQRLGLSDALDSIASKANVIPGFRLLTIVLGVNPVNMAPVDRSAANLLRALLEMIPVVGALIVQALDNHGIFAKVGAWVEAQVRTLGMVGSALKGGLDTFLGTLKWSDIFDLGGVWERAKRIFTEPIDRLIAFGKSLVTQVVAFVREAILLPLAKLAEGTRGYDLLKAVLGEDPVTGVAVPRNAETLIGGFMKLIGQEEVWENIKKGNAVARAWAWFQKALAEVMAFVRQVPTLFVKAFHELEIGDLLLVPRAFGKLAAVFGGFIVDFLKWAGNTVWTLLEIVFEVVSPTTLAYLKKTGAALKGILKNPMPFVRNLIRAAKQGFQSFGDNFGAHLKAGLIDWLTGSLPGVYIPKAFSLGEIVKFVFSVLGLTWANIRPKLVNVVGETAVKAMETGFDIVVTLVTQGPAAAWDKIQEQLVALKDQVVNSIVDMVTDTVIKKAVPKLISMFIPGAGFISTILSIYDTIMVFIDKLAKMVAVVKAFVDGIVAIAAGQIDAAAKRVESSLAGLLSLAISFLAGFLGLGGIADKVMGVITKIRATIDKGLDALIAWIVKMAKSLFAKVFGKGDKPDERTPVQKEADVAAARSDAEKVLTQSDSVDKVRNALPDIKSKYRLTTIELEKTGDDYDVLVTINPTAKTKKKPFDPNNLVVGDVVLGLYKDSRWQDPAKERWVPGTVTSIDAPAKRFRWTSSNLAVPRTGVFDFSDVDKKWKKGHVSQIIIPEDRLLELNQDEAKWNNSIVIARAVLNYRHHQAQLNPPGKEWEHIIEKTRGGGANSSANLALTAATLNNRLGVLFGRPYASHEAPAGMNGTNNLELREYLADKPEPMRYAWKNYFYGKLSVSLKWKTSERGKWQELN
jgi:Domain of unknown function (DUF4157)